MRLRPSCRSWLPLSTQQLRLRNLIRIEGINIKCDDAGALIYYTLHQRNDGKPLYVSEYLPHRQLQKWAEIMCQNVFKSNEASVCVKIWARITTLAATKGVEQCNETLQEDHVRKSYDQDKLLFAWGISLSGLLPLSLKTNAKLVENTLLFHLNGECFTSAEHLLWDISLMFDELKNNQNSFELWQENGLHNEYNCVLESRGISSYSYKSDWKDICNDGVTSRYIRLYFKRSDTRKSYNLHQLLKLQKIQRIHLQRTRESRDFISNIQRRSINCITKNQLFISQIALSRHQAKFAMGRALSELFSEQAQANPYTLLHAQELKKQLETLRLNHRLLQSECDSYSSRIVQQRNRLTSISRIRQQRHSWLRSKNEKLQLEKKLFSKENQEILFLKQKRDEIIRDMERRKSALCVGLREIYPIEKNESGLNTINKVPFPSMDALVKDDRNAYASNIVANILPITLSVSLGYIAHLVQMIALIINRPLRFSLYCRTSIPSKSIKYAIFLLNQNIAQLCYDITGLRCDMRSTLENINQIFIFLSETQNSDQSEQKKSDVYINKSFTPSFNSYKNASNGCAKAATNQLSRSQSSVDINNMPFPLTTAAPHNFLLQLPNSIPLSIEGDSILKQRSSRSVGSYSGSEDDFDDIHRHAYSNSDSNIALSPSQV